MHYAMLHAYYAMKCNEIYNASCWLCNEIALYLYVGMSLRKLRFQTRFVSASNCNPDEFTYICRHIYMDSDVYPHEYTCGNVEIYGKTMTIPCICRFFSEISLVNSGSDCQPCDIFIRTFQKFITTNIRTFTHFLRHLIKKQLHGIIKLFYSNNLPRAII